MTTRHLLRPLFAAVVCAGAVSLSACAGMSRGENTAIGAAVGGVAGSVLTGGSAVGTVGGAVVGGVVGNQTDKKDKKR